MPAPKKTTPQPTAKALKESTPVAFDVLTEEGCLLVTAEDPRVNRHDVWFIPEGVTSFKSSKIELKHEDVTLDRALTICAAIVKESLKDLPTDPADLPVDEETEAEPKKTPAAKKSAPAKKAVAKKA